MEKVQYLVEIYQLDIWNNAVYIHLKMDKHK